MERAMQQAPQLVRHCIVLSQLQTVDSILTEPEKNGLPPLERVLGYYQGIGKKSATALLGVNDDPITATLLSLV